jgi:hypothetical protein
VWAGPETVLEDLQDEGDRPYARSDQRMSKMVYRSQVVRDVFGSGAAQLFLHLMRVDATVVQRVLRSPKSKLRR